jgi:hypothetical protein
MAKVNLYLKESRAALTKGIDNLRKTLEQHPSLSLSTKLKYVTAIAEMALAHHKLSKIQCDPPDMSFELSYAAKPKRGVAKKKKKKTKKGKK